MKLMSYLKDGTPGYGAVTGDGDGLVDLTSRLPARPDLRSLIAGDGLDEARRAVDAAAPDHRLADITFLPPIPAPEKIWCIGVNYADRNEEYKDGSQAQQYPSLFSRVPGSVVGHGQGIERPKISEQYDYEGEIVLVIGRGGRHIPRNAALDHVFGLTLCNEGTVRDWVRHGKFNATQGKNFDRSGAIGPWIVTADDIDIAAPLELTTRVNGELRQSDSTARLMFPFDYLVSYLSEFATLKPGDLIVTGTPTGAGARFDPPRWLKPGDVVEVEVPGIGILANPVIDEP
jgi:2-keto-4-pentenoate hydratase/2-oxohepta-3-ene-1,7-dioic acid hydratase in catechol pathway